MLNHIWRLTRKYDLTFDNSRIFIDGANPSFIRSLKTHFGENPEYEEMIARYKRDFPHYNWIQDMFVIPVNFSQEHRTLLIHAKMVLESKEYAIAINQRFDKLITSLRTAVESGEGVLDKQTTSFNDIFDAFRLALNFYK
jgi:hypothetical protein